MSRFFKSAAFPILIVVVLAFLAVKLVNPSAPTTARTATRRWSAKELPKGEVESVEFKNKGKALEVKLKQGHKESYEIGYIDQAAPELIKELENLRRAVQRRIGKEQRAARACSPTSCRSRCSSASGSSS